MNRYCDDKTAENWTWYDVELLFYSRLEVRLEQTAIPGTGMCKYDYVTADMYSRKREDEKR